MKPNNLMKTSLSAFGRFSKVTIKLIKNFACTYNNVPLLSCWLNSWYQRLNIAMCSCSWYQGNCFAVFDIQKMLHRAHILDFNQVTVYNLVTVYSFQSSYRQWVNIHTLIRKHTRPILTWPMSSNLLSSLTSASNSCANFICCKH